MEITFKELWTVFHGMGFGAVFLLAFAGALVELYYLEPKWLTLAGASKGLFRLKLGLWVMTIISWITVISGTWLIYIWYRATPPSGATLSEYPRYFLLSKPTTKGWHEFGMEWKEHVSWLAPMLMTSVAYTAHYYSEELTSVPKIRKALFWIIIIAFSTAAIAGIFGAFINKIAATR